MNGFFTNKKVLIIGGTGTIGKSLLKTILIDQPAVIRIFSRDEHKQFELQQQLGNLSTLRYLIGDVRDEARLVRAMQNIDYVFHVAAMKHVPSCEYNPFEAMKTNVLGTQNVIQAALSAGVKKVIFTSTDKAVSPTNTYGASKLMAERLIASAQYQTGPNATVFAAVRFGNVMGSRGSVIPLFKNQIQQNKSITITNLSMSRFMMTLQQATDLTIQAMEQAQGGEIFVLKMPVVRLQDLANLLIKHTCQAMNLAESEVQIQEIGLRPGEKMYEELMTEDESHHAIELDDMFVIPNPFLDSIPTYLEARPVLMRNYSSHEVDPIAYEELEQLLVNHKLTDLN